MRVALSCSETGQKPPETIDLYYLDEFIDKFEGNGFNGTIIHFYDEKKDINQMITIPRGTEMTEQNDWRSKDWAYNLIGIFGGQNVSQYRTARDFNDEVTAKIESNFPNVELTKYGLDQSLGGNLITLMQLPGAYFDHVYTTNHAPPPTYQLQLIGEDFKEVLHETYNLDVEDPYTIYDPPPSALESFTEEYYKGAGENITHLVMDQDIL